MIENLMCVNPNIQLIAKGLIDLHRLIRQGNDDSPEGESIRDALDAPLKRLSRTEKERTQWLSEDLYSISEPSASDLPKDATGQERISDGIEARENQESDRALALLRQVRDSISPALLSYHRGVIWLEAGYPEIAAEFFGHASESEPANASYRASYLHALAEIDPDAARAFLPQHESV